MPQLDITSFPSQIFWLLVCFGSFFLVLSFFVLPMTREVLEKRALSINDLVEEAKKDRLSAETIENESVSKLSEMRKGCMTDVENALASLRKSFSEQQKALKDEQLKSLEKSFSELNKEFDSSLKLLKKETSELAKVALNKLVIK